MGKKIRLLFIQLIGNQRYLIHYQSLQKYSNNWKWNKLQVLENSNRDPLEAL